MKYSVETVINLPVDEVVALFDDPENLKHWQPGLKVYEYISGEPGQPGAKSRLVFDMGNRDIEMIETITVRNLPDEFSGTYEAKGVFNTVVNRFIPLGPDKTRYVSEQEFRFSGMMKFFAVFIHSAFKKQSQKYLDLFKAYAEKQ